MNFQYLRHLTKLKRFQMTPKEIIKENYGEDQDYQVPNIS